MAGVDDAVARADESLQWGHGREAMDGCRPAGSVRTERRFNGAMAVRPWMDPHRLRNPPHRAASMGPWP